MTDPIEIGDRTIGPGQPLFLIAECGVTCNYDLDITKDLIDVVAESGADAIKLIFWFPDEIMAEKSIQYTYETVDGTNTRDMYDMLSELQFTLDEWRQVKAYADEKDVILFSTVNSPSGVEYAEELDLDAYKLSSWEYNHHPLWRRIARIGKPMFLDTGPVRTDDVAKVINLMHEENNKDSVLIHCYHTDNPSEMNMRSIPYLRKAFHSLVGYSSPDSQDENDVAAITLGASVIEKRLTLDRELPGHHHAISKPPEEFVDYVSSMRDVHAALGEETLNPSAADLAERKKWFRHLVADRDLDKGTKLTADMLAGKRRETRSPEKTVSPEHMDFFVGKTLNQSLEHNEPITWEDIG